MIRVLVVEDSPTMQGFLVWILQRDPEIEVVGMARDGAEAVRLAARIRPDVITMDAHMPHVDGSQATQRIMHQTPTPIVIASSSLDPKDARITFKALQAGALAAVEKPLGPAGPDQDSVCQQLITTVKLMSEVKVVTHRTGEASIKPPRPVPHRAPEEIHTSIIAIASSTGGPGALRQVLGPLPADLPAPVLVVQHMSPGFGQGFADWLDGATRLPVKTARQGEPLAPGRVLVAPDDRHMLVRPDSHVLLRSRIDENGLCPSANPLFASVAEAFGHKALGVILTGMGRDGVEGLKQLKAAGGQVLAQGEASCVVFGMPKEAIAAGVVDRVVPLEHMAATIMRML